MLMNKAEDVQATADLADALAHPLNSLMATVELLQRQPLTPAAGVQVQTILDLGRRMANLLCDSVETQTLTAPEPPAPTALRALVDDVEAYWRSRFRDDVAKLIITCNAPTELRVMVDPASVRRLLNTLINSAFEARAWGVIEVQLSVSMQKDGSVLVKGRVEAPGAYPAIIPAVALDLCRSIVKRMDGTLDQNQTPGSGIQASFTLNVPEAGHDVVEEEAEADGPLPPRTHLLIVDDNATNRIVASALCEMFGCTSESVEDGLEAVEAVSSRHFDLVLMDIKMPNMDGMQATKAIRAMTSAAGSVPIVALTANADPEAVATYLACGMQAVVDKPIKPAQLLSTLQSVFYGQGEEAPMLQASAA